MSQTKNPIGHWRFRIDSLDAAYRVARESFGGWVFIVLNLLGVFIAAVGATASNPEAADAQFYLLVGLVVTTLLVAFCAYRVRIGKGWIAGPILVLMFLYEIYVKVNAGQLRNPGWIVFHLAILASLVMGAIACWQVRRRQRRGEVRTYTL